MERGAIPVADLPGGIDLQSTLESGQSFHWRRADGRTYETTGCYGGTAWYETVVDGEVLRARRLDGHLEWASTADGVPLLSDLLRLGDDLDAIVAATPGDPLVDEAYETYPGMRLTRDPFFHTLVTFICSAQMRVERIFSMVQALAETYGTHHEVGGRTYHAFPRPDQLAAATEAELRDLKLGYRAPYVLETARMTDAGELTREDLPGDYEAARDALRGFPGVGPKVADCVCLFSLGHLEAVPLDTWIRTAIEEHYPECERGNYRDTSRAIRDRFGPYAGYAQTYVFHHLRHGREPPVDRSAR